MRWLRAIIPASLVVFALAACAADRSDPEDVGVDTENVEGGIGFSIAPSCINQCGDDSGCVACCLCLRRGGEPENCCF